MAKPLTFGNYVVLEQLGAGGMGVVYKARQRGSQQLAAVKVLAPEITRQEDARRRFQREARAAAALSHPNIVAAREAGEERGTHFFVMDYVDGVDLARLVRKQGPLGLAQAVDCTLQAARGLDHAHAAGIIHRDVKPSNLLLDSRGTVKVLDLGMARLAKLGDKRGNETTLDDLTRTGSLMGTSDYMAPEQAMNAKTADARADVYSLGCTLFFLRTGNPMYSGETMMEKVFAHREKPIPPLPGASRNLQAIFARMVAKEPADRFASMAEVIAALQPCTVRRKRRWIVGVLGAAAAAVVVTGALLSFRTGHKDAKSAPQAAPVPASIFQQIARPASTAPYGPRKDKGPTIVWKPAGHGDADAALQRALGELEGKRLGGSAPPPKKVTSPQGAARDIERRKEAAPERPKAGGPGS